jgi:hypothetical protein
MKKRPALPADPREALREITGRAEDLSALADRARSRADDALDLARDAAEKAEALYHLTDQAQT